MYCFQITETVFINATTAALILYILRPHNQYFQDHLNVIFPSPSQHSKRMFSNNTELLHMHYLIERFHNQLIRICWKHMFWKLTVTWSDKSHTTHTETSPSPHPTSRNMYPELISVHQPMSVIESRLGANWSLVNACQLDHPLADLFAHWAHLMKGPFGYCRAHSVWKLRMTAIWVRAVFMLVGLHKGWYKPVGFSLCWTEQIPGDISQQGFL
jgi:hypothetical protein